MKSDSGDLPGSFTIEIDRQRLRLYLRVSSFAFLLPFLGVWGGLFGFLSITKEIDAGKFRTMKDVLISAIWHASGGFLVGAGLGLLFYLAYCHWQAASHAKDIVLSVEGPFLRLQTGSFFRRDRKIHFRAIHDYSVIDNWFSRRLGIQVLRMSVTGGMQPYLSVAGVKDCLKMRDLLAEVDARRENG